MKTIDPIRPLRDGHGRFIRDVRVSVTDRCNFRCQYCMPAEGLPWLERDQVLSFEEIERLVRVLASMGVCDVRLTGGEPLVRRDFPRLAGMLAAVEGVKDLSVTTNGFLLERDAAAGTVIVITTARVYARTGVEMEAMVGCAAGALCVYDMVKGIERGVVIDRVELLGKSGGRSGTWRRDEQD